MNRGTSRADAITSRRGMQAAALCLEYPDDDWPARLALLDEAGASLPGAAGASLRGFLAWATGDDPAAVAHAYVDTFDLQLRCCPYLTYYSHGDTRKRGMALLEFTHAYRTAGFEIASGELPDHVAVLCEFTARAGEPGLALFARQRAGLELLHLALSEAASPYAHVTSLVRCLLPEAPPADMQRALELARSGPPAEEVGLEPFGPPETTGARR